MFTVEGDMSTLDWCRNKCIESVALKNIPDIILVLFFTVNRCTFPYDISKNVWNLLDFFHISVVWLNHAKIALIMCPDSSSLTWIHPRSKWVVVAHKKRGRLMHFRVSNSLSFSLYFLCSMFLYVCALRGPLFVLIADSNKQEVRAGFMHSWPLCMNMAFLIFAKYI